VLGIQANGVAFNKREHSGKSALATKTFTPGFGQFSTFASANRNFKIDRPHVPDRLRIGPFARTIFSEVFFKM